MFSLVLFIVLTTKGFSKTVLCKQKVFQGLGTSTSQRRLDTIPKAKGEWENGFSRYHPINEVWRQTQQWKEGGGLRKHRSSSRLCLIVFSTLTRSFWSALAVIEESSFSSRKIKSMFCSSISGLWCNAFNWLKGSGLFWFLTETISFTMLNN